MIAPQVAQPVPLIVPLTAPLVASPLVAQSDSHSVVFRLMLAQENSRRPMEFGGYSFDRNTSPVPSAIASLEAELASDAYDDRLETDDDWWGQRCFKYAELYHLVASHGITTFITVPASRLNSVPHIEALARRLLGDIYDKSNPDFLASFKAWQQEYFMDKLRRAKPNVPTSITMLEAKLASDEYDDRLDNDVWWQQRQTDYAELFYLVSTTGVSTFITVPAARADSLGDIEAVVEARLTKEHETAHALACGYFTYRFDETAMSPGMYFNEDGSFGGDVDVGDLLPSDWKLKNEKYKSSELFENFKPMYDKMKALLCSDQPANKEDVTVLLEVIAHVHGLMDKLNGRIVYLDALVEAKEEKFQASNLKRKKSKLPYSDGQSTTLSYLAGAAGQARVLPAQIKLCQQEAEVCAETGHVPSCSFIHRVMKLLKDAYLSMRKPATELLQV